MNPKYYVKLKVLQIKLKDCTMFPLPDQLGNFGSATIPEIPASETPASFNFKISSSARNLIQQIASAPNKQAIVPMINKLMKDRTVNNELKNKILSSLREGDFNVIRKKFKELHSLSKPVKPMPEFDVGDGPSLPVIPASETPASFNVSIDPQPVVQSQARPPRHLVVPKTLKIEAINKTADGVPTSSPKYPPITMTTLPAIKPAIPPQDNRLVTQEVKSEKESSKTPYIIGGAVLLSAVGGYFIWKGRQS